MITAKQMTLYEKEQFYDKLYDTISELQKKYNICNVAFVNGRFTCRRDKKKENNGCCGGCSHLCIKSGCKCKSLMCKMWICTAILNNKKLQKRAKEYFDFLEEANNFILKNNIPVGFRLSKEENFANPTREYDIFLDKDWYKCNARFVRIRR
jgi:hypothetical protein